MNPLLGEMNVRRGEVEGIGGQALAKSEGATFLPRFVRRIATSVQIGGNDGDLLNEYRYERIFLAESRHGT